MLCVVSSTYKARKWYIACILPSNKKSGKIAFRSHQRLQREIWCNCGAFAPYFFPSLPGRGRLPRRAHRRYGATVARLRRIFFLRSLIGDDSPGGRKEDSAQLWRICAVFFYFSFTSKVENVLGFLPYIIVPKVWRFMDTARFV